MFWLDRVGGALVPLLRDAASAGGDDFDVVAKACEGATSRRGWWRWFRLRALYCVRIEDAAEIFRN